jgi:hypothetical protein
MRHVPLALIRLELGRLNLRLHPASRYRVTELEELAAMLLEDILPHKVTEAEFSAVIRRWRVKNNFIPKSKDVFEQLKILRAEMDAKQQLALAAAPEPMSDKYCEDSKRKIAKYTPRQHGSRV